MKYFLCYFSIIFKLIIGTHSSNDSIESCIDSKFHKQKPGKESSLFNQCEPWKEYSCCTQDITIKAHNKTNHYKFNFDHCRQMSDECRKHFIQDLCFYECEPNLKPWIVNVNRSFAKQRIFKVPICSSDCDIWWDKCKHDYTCAYNWPKDFKWINGTNICHHKDSCKPMQQIYSGAQEFCENVWDHSWKYTEEDKPCIRIWFNGSIGNPNRNTALYYANQLNHSNSSKISFVFLLITLIIILYEIRL